MGPILEDDVKAKRHFAEGLRRRLMSIHGSVQLQCINMIFCYQLFMLHIISGDEEISSDTLELPIAIILIQ